MRNKIGNGVNFGVVVAQKGNGVNFGGVGAVQEGNGVNFGVVVAVQKGNGVNFGGVYAAQKGNGANFGLITYNPNKSFLSWKFMPLVSINDSYNSNFIGRYRKAIKIVDNLEKHSQLEILRKGKGLIYNIFKYNTQKSMKCRALERKFKDLD